jgi:hypothetical protein
MPLVLEIDFRFDGEGDTRYHSWLRHYVTSRKVAVSIRDEVVKCFN